MSMIYVGTVIMVQPYWIAEIAANFLYFNNINHKIFEHLRPFEALFRYANASRLESLQSLIPTLGTPGGSSQF
jgi:hypothetical protein